MSPVTLLNHYPPTMRATMRGIMNFTQNYMRYFSSTIITLSLLISGFALALPVFASAQSLPPGVTLQQIDGGPNYYCSHNFTYACNAGWDSPSFFPIGPWLAPMRTQSDANRWLDLGLNTAWALTADSPLSLLRQNGMYAAIQQNEYTRFGAFGNEVVGMMSCDECGTVASAFDTPIGTTPNSFQDNRFWWFNNTWNFIEYGDIGGTPAPQLLTRMITTPNGTQRHINIDGVDIYWESFAVAGAKYQGGQIYNLGRDMTYDEARRPSHYGDMVDRLRAYQTTYNEPLVQIVENGGPMNEDTSASEYITPPELNAADWSSIIHGARGIIYFNHTFAGPAHLKTTSQTRTTRRYSPARPYPSTTKPKLPKPRSSSSPRSSTLRSLSAT